MTRMLSKTLFFNSYAVQGDCATYQLQMHYLFENGKG
jgi:hypothetical protein